MGIYSSKEEETIEMKTFHADGSLGRFEIQNYLAKDINVRISLPTGEIWEVGTINAFQRKFISVASLMKGTEIEILIDGDLFNKYLVNRDKSKALLVGQLVAENDESDGESNRQAGHSGHALQGRPFIKIHNLTNFELSFNENITIAPRTTLKYRGRHSIGVPLGLKLKNNEGLFEECMTKVPVTDIYFGKTTIE